MCCVQTVQKVKVYRSPEGKPEFYESARREQNKFIIQSHINKKHCRLPFPIQKSEQLAKLITSKLRQTVK